MSSLLRDKSCTQMWPLPFLRSLRLANMAKMGLDALVTLTSVVNIAAAWVVDAQVATVVVPGGFCIQPVSASSVET